MVKKTAYGSVKRLGTRYGRTLKFKLGKIEAEQRKKHKCPYCNYEQVRRKALGIWYCKKCKATFTSKAYTVGKLGPVIKPLAAEELPPMPEAQEKAYEAKEEDTSEAEEEASEPEESKEE
jgi:large subunit ribosomal protein L37Ae